MACRLLYTKFSDQSARKIGAQVLFFLLKNLFQPIFDKIKYLKNTLNTSTNLYVTSKNLKHHLRNQNQHKLKYIPLVRYAP